MTPIRLSLAALAFLIAASPASADPSAEDRAAVQSVISEQIAAFSRDDGPAAYGFAADAIRQLFPSPERFLDMVRQAYAPVYRPKTRVFGQISDGDDGGLAQEVLITDAEGVDWVARYTLARDAEGRWRITGCRLVKNDREAA